MIATRAFLFSFVVLILIQSPLLVTGRSKPDKFYPFQGQAASKQVQTAEANNGNGLGRKLLTDSSRGGCIWNEVVDGCVYDYGNAAELLYRSNNSFTNYIADVFTCFAHHDKDSCVNEDACYWIEWWNTCTFQGYGIDHKDSPCVKAAPAIMTFQDSSCLCQKETTIRGCNAEENCLWSVYSTCNADKYQIFFGFDSKTSFDKELDEILDSKRSSIRSEWAKAYDTNSRSFDWKQVLEWKVPITSCPKNADEKICNYADAFLETVIPSEIYCSGSYSGESSIACNNDQLCTYGYFSGTCGISYTTRNEGDDSGYLTLINSIENKVDRDLEYVSFICPDTKEADCYGICEWDETKNTCYRNGTYLYESLSQPYDTDPEARSDPVCKVFKIESDDKCEEFTTRRKCNAKKRCEWKVRDVCQVADNERLRLAKKSAKDLSRRQKPVWKTCGYNLFESMCSAA